MNEPVSRSGTAPLRSRLCIGTLFLSRDRKGAVYDLLLILRDQDLRV